MNLNFTITNRYVALLLIIASFHFHYCAKERRDELQQEKFDSAYMQQNPIKGEIDLRLEERIEIDPSKQSLPDDLLFDDLWRDTDGSVYLFDYKNFKLYQFDSRGKKIGSFLSKGEGPGEILNYPHVQLADSHLFVIAGKKIIKFSKNGEFIREHKLRDFYFSVQILTDDRFIALKLVNSSNSSTENGYTKELSIYDLNTEQRLIKIFSSRDTGRFYIKPGGRSMAVIPDPGIIPDVVYNVDIQRQRIHLAENNRYQVYVKDFNNNLKIEFSRPVLNPVLPETGKKMIAGEITTVPDLNKLIHEALPDRLCAIEEIIEFSNGDIGIYHIVGYNRFELDIFDTNGRYLYLLKFPEDFKPYRFKIYDDVLGMLIEKEDIVVYREYYIKSLGEIFRKPLNHSPAHH